MRAALLAPALLLTGCSLVYPADDFHTTTCGEDLTHWAGPKSCRSDLLTCLTGCDMGDGPCARDCYGGGDCGYCFVGEWFICLRQAGCETEYEGLMCCAEEAGCDLADQACVGVHCAGEAADFSDCSSEVSWGCTLEGARACTP